MKIRKISKQEIAEYLAEVEAELGRKLTDEQAETAALDYSYLHQFDEADLEAIDHTLGPQIERVRGEVAELVAKNATVEIVLGEEFDKMANLAGQLVRFAQLYHYRVALAHLAAKQQVIIVPPGATPEAQ